MARASTSRSRRRGSQTFDMSIDHLPGPRLANMGVHGKPVGLELDYLGFTIRDHDPTGGRRHYAMLLQLVAIGQAASRRSW